MRVLRTRLYDGNLGIVIILSLAFFCIYGILYDRMGMIVLCSIGSRLIYYSVFLVLVV